MSKEQPDPRAAAARLKRLSRLRPTLAMVLGSGFHHVLSELRVEAEISYSKLPGFPPTGVSGHAGQLFIGLLGGTPVMVLSGRAHYYEGHPMTRVDRPHQLDGRQPAAGRAGARFAAIR
jgi:purine-nucleoside phosphorylase